MYHKLSAKTLPSEVCIWFDVQWHYASQAMGRQNMAHKTFSPISAPFWSFLLITLRTSLHRTLSSVWTAYLRCHVTVTVWNLRKVHFCHSPTNVTNVCTLCKSRHYLADPSYSAGHFLLFRLLLRNRYHYMYVSGVLFGFTWLVLFSGGSFIGSIPQYSEVS